MAKSVQRPLKRHDALIGPFDAHLNSFDAAVRKTRMPMVFADAQVGEKPIVFVNSAFLSLSGFEASAVLGKPLQAFFDNHANAAASHSIRSAMETGGEGTWEMQCRRADGSTYLASVFMSSVRDRQGAVRQHFLCLVQLGDHADQLFRLRDEFKALYELGPVFVAIFEGTCHRHTFANPSYRKLIAREHVLGLTLAEAMPEMVKQGFIEILDGVYRTGEPYVGTSIPVEIRPKDSTIVEIYHVDCICRAVRGADNCISGLFWEGYDVSEQHRLREAQYQLQSELIFVSRVNAMGTMATTLAHELNQPMAAIVNYVGASLTLIDSSSENAGKLTEALQGIEEATRKAAEIVHHLRELTGRQKPKRTTFDLKQSVRECIRLIRASEPPGVEFVDEIKDGINMTADRVQIQQVIINLLHNASKAGLASGRPSVLISASEVEDNVIVSVVDSGPGLTADAAASVFSWTEPENEGRMGLGLSICRTIIEAHRGRIWLQNSGPEGSEFCFSISHDPGTPARPSIGP